jgi:hypothetical protein
MGPTCQTRVPRWACVAATRQRRSHALRPLSGPRAARPDRLTPPAPPRSSLARQPRAARRSPHRSRRRPDRRGLKPPTPVRRRAASPLARRRRAAPPSPRR